MRWEVNVQLLTLLLLKSLAKLQHRKVLRPPRCSCCSRPQPPWQPHLPGPGNRGISAFDPAVSQGLLNESFVVSSLLVTKSLQQAAVNPKAGLSTPTCY